MTDAQLTGLGDHRDYENSAEEIAGSPPADDQKYTAAEWNRMRDTVDQHAPLINTLIADLLGIIAGSTDVTLATLKSETEALNLILSADDSTLDTAQERVDKIKQLLADIDSLVIADIAGLQTTLDGLQTGKEAAGVAQSLVTALEATIRGAGAVGVTLTSLKSETDALSAILSSDDSTLDTAQERVDKIKQLLSDIDTLAIGDVAGLQTVLNELQSSIDLYKGSQPNAEFKTVGELLSGTFSASADDVLLVATRNFSYTVALSAATDHHLVTAGGVKLYVNTMNVDAFGADPTGLTSSSSAIQNAINVVLNSGNGKLEFPPGKYLLDADLYFCYDQNNNSAAPSDNLLNGRFTITGAGRMTRRDYERDNQIGTILKFTAGHKAIFSALSGTRSWMKTVTDLSIIGDNPNMVYDPFATTGSNYKRVFIGSNTTATNTAVMYVSDSYLASYEDIEIIGDKGLDAKRVGWGFWADPSDTAGGGNRYVGINCAFFDKGIVIGNPYDSTRASQTHNSKGNVMTACQGHYSNVGIHIMQNTNSLTMTACWGEQCTVAPIKVSDSASGIEIVSSIASFASTGITGKGQIVIGDDTGTQGVDHARNVTIRNTRMSPIAGTAGVYVYDAAQDIRIVGNHFNNSGGCAVGVEGGIGGEIYFSGNDYFPTTAASEISVGRRLCTIDGTTYADHSYFAAELDWVPSSLAADLDCSDWRRPPAYISFNSLAGSRTLILPILSLAGGRLAKFRVYKGFAANDVIIDAQAGGSIRGQQTLVLSDAYSSQLIIHRGNGSNVWDSLG